jgi:hypothetical protein
VLGTPSPPDAVGGSVPRTNDDGITEGTSEAPMAEEGDSVAGTRVPPIGAVVLGLDVPPGGNVPVAGGNVDGTTVVGVPGTNVVGGNVPVAGGNVPVAGGNVDGTTVVGVPGTNVVGGNVPVAGGNVPVAGGNVDGTTVVGVPGTNVVGGNVPVAGGNVPKTGLKVVGGSVPTPELGGSVTGLAVASAGGTVTAPTGLKVVGGNGPPATGLEEMGLNDVGAAVPEIGIGVGADVVVPPAAVGLAVVGTGTATGLLDGGDVPATIGLEVSFAPTEGAEEVSPRLVGDKVCIVFGFHRQTKVKRVLVSNRSEKGQPIKNGT